MLHFYSIRKRLCDLGRLFYQNWVSHSTHSHQRKKETVPSMVFPMFIAAHSFCHSRGKKNHGSSVSPHFLSYQIYNPSGNLTGSSFRMKSEPDPFPTTYSAGTLLGTRAFSPSHHCNSLLAALPTSILVLFTLNMVARVFLSKYEPKQVSLPHKFHPRLLLIHLECN